MRQVLDHLGELEDEDMEIEQGYEFTEHPNTSMPGGREKTYELKVGDEEYRVRDWKRSGKVTWLAVVRTSDEEGGTPWISVEGDSGVGTEYATHQEAMSAVVERIKAKRSDTSLALAKSQDGDMQGPPVLLHNQVAKVQESMANYRASAESFVRSVISLGRELNTLKSMVQHGEWEPLLRDDPMNYGLTPRRLRDFMRMAEYADENPGQLEDVRSVNQALELIKEHRRFVQQQIDGPSPALAEGVVGEGDDEDEWLHGDDEDDGESMDYEPSHLSVVLDMEPSAVGQEREIITQPTYQILDAEPMPSPAPMHQPEPQAPLSGDTEPQVEADPDPNPPLEYTVAGYGDITRAARLDCSLADLPEMLERTQQELGYDLGFHMVMASIKGFINSDDAQGIGELFRELKRRGIIAHGAGLLVVPEWGWPGMFMDFGYEIGAFVSEVEDMVLLDLTPDGSSAIAATSDGWLYIGVTGPGRRPLPNTSDVQDFGIREFTPEELAQWLTEAWWRNEPG